jgi:hypothetical protein
MRPFRTVALALTLLTMPSAVALAVAQAGAQGFVTVNVNPHHSVYGRRVAVTGTSGPAGQRLALEFAPAGDASWRQLGSTQVRSDGRFEFLAPLRQSGLIRVVDASTTGTQPTAAGGAADSGAQSVVVAAVLRVPAKAIDVLGSRQIQIRGRLLPAVAGRKVHLLGRGHGGWHTLATARTGSGGGFALRYSPSSSSGGPLRVGFGGDAANGRSSAYAGHVIMFHASGASWYDDSGATACGFHAGDGVANRDLPCGTKVRFRYGGRSVTAVVDDRGPFVAGRDWDLNQNTAAALGFTGVDTVWWST